MQTRKIALIDDHVVVREGLARLLAEEQHNNIVAQFDNGEDAIHYSRDHTLDVAVVDINMEGIDGLQTTQRLKKIQPALKIAILSVNEVEPFITKSFDAGADAFLSKRCAPAEISDTITAICSGEKYVSDHVCRQMALDKLNNKEDLLKTLTNREFEVFRLLAAGNSVNDIAEQLCISPKTAYVFRGNILRKLSLSSLADIIHLAQRRNVI